MAARRLAPPATLRTKVVAGLPKYAWAAVVRDRAVEAVVGAGVEVGDRFLAEGAWAGAFSEPAALSWNFRCASGLVVRGGDIFLFAPSHSLEAVYHHTAPDGAVTASNSLPLLAALLPEAGIDFEGYKAIRPRAGSLVKGLNYNRVLLESTAGVLRQLSWHTLRIRAGVQEEILPEPHPSPFQSYEAYRDHLHETLAAVVQNARHPSRTSLFGKLVTSVSTGYDSVACAALAKRVGGAQAVTLTTARGGHDDSGKPVADALGIPCLEFERTATVLEEKQGYDFTVRKHSKVFTLQNRPFIGSPNTETDTPYLPFAEAMAGSVFLSGFHGDKVWPPNCPSGAEVKRGDKSGSGMGEFRLRVGFVHVPVPYIGVRHHEEIRAIARSPEMAPWRIGGAYDRPIPRRIAEEEGVPRQAFGMHKRAGAALIEAPWPNLWRAFNNLSLEYAQALAGTGFSAGARPG